MHPWLLLKVFTIFKMVSAYDGGDPIYVENSSNNLLPDTFWRYNISEFYDEVNRSTFEHRELHKKTKEHVDLLNRPLYISQIEDKKSSRGILSDYCSRVRNEIDVRVDKKKERERLWQNELKAAQENITNQDNKNTLLQMIKIKF